MKTFQDLDFKPYAIGDGVQARMDFDNNFGVSVIKFRGSYGYPNLWEVAVMHNGNLCYDTYITDDVLGHQTDEEVTDIMAQVQALKTIEQ